MRKVLLLSLILLYTGIVLRAQTPQVLKKVMELKMPGDADDDMPGTRGASVVWHPVQKKYYASFAGNVDYPLAVFDVTGKRLSDEELTTKADTRGLWYNPALKLICGNAYDDGGWFTYTLDNSGIPTDAEVIKEGMHQPGVQSQGIYNTVSKQVLFLYVNKIHMYNKEAEPVDSVVIHWGRTKADGVSDYEDLTELPENYNSSAAIYFGAKGQEVGFLNITNKEVELYDIKTGFLTKKLAFPETSVVESIFNFAYANGIYWLFNIELRKWVGYK